MPRTPMANVRATANPAARKTRRPLLLPKNVAKSCCVRRPCRWPTAHRRRCRAVRHQVWELPRKIRPIVTEYQRHRLVCSCGCSTLARRTSAGCADRPGGAAAHRLRRLAHGLLSSVEAASGPIHEHDSESAPPARLLVSLQNRVAEAVKPAYDEVAAQLPEQPTPHIDESPTRGNARLGLDYRGHDVLRLLRLPHQSGRRSRRTSARTFAGIFCDRAPHVLVLRPAAMVLGSLETRFPRADRQPCQTNKRLGRDPDEAHGAEMFAASGKSARRRMRVTFRRHETDPSKDRCSVCCGYCNTLTLRLLPKASSNTKTTCGLRGRRPHRA